MTYIIYRVPICVVINSYTDNKYSSTSEIIFNYDSHNEKKIFNYRYMFFSSISFDIIEYLFLKDIYIYLDFLLRSTYEPVYN